MKDAPSSDLLRQAHIKSENQLLVSLILFGKIVQTLIEVQEHILFFNQGGPIYHGTHVPGPVSKSSVETQYNAVCTAGMAIAHFRVLINQLFNKDPDRVPQEDPLIILDSKSAVCMNINGKDTNHTSQISIIVNIVSNYENTKFTRFTSVKKVYNWQELQLIMLVIET